MSLFVSRRRWALNAGMCLAVLVTVAACLGPHPLEGNPAPSFVLRASDGSQFGLAEHKGKDVVLLDFWATWCPPCRKGLPAVAALAHRLDGKPVAVFPINVGESEEQVREFLKQQEMDIPVGLDILSDVAGRFRIDAFPTTMIIDQNGVVAKVYTGYRPGLEEEIEADILRLLDPS